MAVYFASDVHLGLKFRSQDAQNTELRFVEWLRSIESDCDRLFLVGDIFDFWFEWKRVVPKGYVRLLGQLAAMSDRGIEINIFAGNHDLWLNEYFEQELGAKVYLKEQRFDIQGRNVLIAHGDNVGKRAVMHRLLSSIFRSSTARWLFSRLVHPNISMRFGLSWSSSRRHDPKAFEYVFSGEESYLVQYARQCPGYDYYIFGHLHTPTIHDLNDVSKVVILGEWIRKPVYGRMENGVLELKSFGSIDQV